ncbi:MAG: sigma-70 family RNA polymerase sigma factor [Fuerstiella sp.]
MTDTSLSLLQRLRDTPESQSWERLVELYAPLIRSWLMKYEVQDTDAADLMQEVLLAVSKDVRRFEHAGRPGAFRAWLKEILVNRLRNFWRTRDRRPKLADGSMMLEHLKDFENPNSELSQLWNAEHDRYVLRQLLTQVEPQVTPQTWTAFCRVALEGQTPREVASEMGISLNAVVIAKSRVLNKLRQEANGIVESSSNFLADR